MSRKYVSYRRVSTEEQGKSGLGLDAQERAIAAFVEAEGGEVIADFSDVMSGKHDDRPELLKALAYARKHKAWIVTSKLDRLSRDVEFIAGLMNRKVRFVCANMGHDVDEFMLHIYASLGQKERKLISQRTREALAELKAQGVRLGKEQNLVEGRVKATKTIKERAEKRAASVLPIIDHIRSQGLVTLEAIAAELNRREVKTPRGGDWHKTTVARALRRVT
ncbi:recombinase family protein [Microvirga calopogonii]|uniref:recombinase family protein n=1 Tax=Microvirga calopogonii TaxID=2078013 RepID=UPI000E0D8DD7|nr:recombinase family protein [Microvirga calopogonii]